MAELQTQTTLRLADGAGDWDKNVLRFLKKTVVNNSDMTSWADMLSMIGRKNSQLYNFVARASRPRVVGKTIVQELERERLRIARELHAGAGQPLAAIKLNLEILDEYSTALPPRGREAVARLQMLAEQAVEQVRAVSHSLHPPKWQDLTVEKALCELIESSGLVSLFSVQLDIGPLSLEPPHTTKIAIYRCAQECISNILRHAGATRLALSLKICDTMFELRVEDNGHGFAPDKCSTGIGLTALHDHSSALGGTCNIASGPSGTTIVVLLPLAED